MTSVNKPVTALARETALILLEEGKHQFKAGDTLGARSSFQEACGLDPENAEIWKCLAMVSEGKEQEEYLARASQSVPGKGPKVALRVPVSNKQLLVIVGILGALLVVGLLLLGAFTFWRSWQVNLAVSPTAVPTPGPQQISVEKGGKVFLNGEAGLWIPANSLPNILNTKYQFQVVYALEKDLHPFPESDLLKPVGRAVQVIAPDTILRQQAWFTLRYNPDELPANTDPASLQVARWDGSSWSISPREIDTAQKVVYVPIDHFSSPVYRIVAITAPPAPSAMAKQVDEANRLFFQNERDPQAKSAGLYEKAVLSIKSTNELFALSASDRMNYWMAYNLWGDALFASGQYAQAGVVYLSCVQTGMQGVLPVDWQDHIMTGPGYALQALQNRYPFGVSLTQELLAQPWAAGLPQDAFTLATQNYYWHENRTDPWSDLPVYIQQTITTSENTQAERPFSTPATSWSVLILSPQSQTDTLLASTLNETVTPILQSTGIKNITAAMLKTSAAQMRAQVEAMLKTNPTENAYSSETGLAGTERQQRTPLLLLRVERAWTNTQGETTHTQYLFGLHAASSGAGDALIAKGDTFKLGSDGKLTAAPLQYSWAKLDPDSTRNIQLSINFGLYSLSAGKNHTCVINSSSQVECWGDNTNGLLGTIAPVVDFEIKPKLVNGLGNIVQVSSGETHTCALEDSQMGGRVFCWGGNDFGQLGSGTNEIQKTPVVVSLPEKATFLSAGARHTCAVGQSGQAYCWGSNAGGQLGLDKTAAPSSNSPTPVPGLANAKEITAGNAHTCALQGDGRVYCWGSNSYGQLGSQGESTFSPKLVSGLTGVMSITSGESHTCALTSQGAVFCWGYNGAGQVGSGSTESKVFTPAPVKGLQTGVTFVASYKNHTCAVQNSIVLCWGINTSGELGNGVQEAKQITPVAVQGLPANSRWLSVTAGDGFTCSRDDTGFVYCWGKNEAGQLGNQTLALSVSPQPVIGLGVLADTASQLEISPVKGTALEMGVTVHIKASKVPAGAKTIVYRVKMASKDWVEIGREAASANPTGITYTAVNVQPQDKALFSAIFEMDQGQPASPTPLELTVVDTREPTGEIQILPPAQIIELGSSITFAAKNVSDAVGGITGSGVKEVTFKVTENGVEMFSQTITTADNKPYEVTWPVPLARKNNNTRVAFGLKVVDNAGNEFTTPLTDGFILSDRHAPTFLGNLLVKGEKVSDHSIEMGTSVNVTVSTTDVYDVDKQGSGIREVTFMASTNDKDYTAFDRITYGDAATTREATSAKAWSSVGQAYGQAVRFKAVVIDIAGNASEQFSEIFHMADTTPPVVDFKTDAADPIITAGTITATATVTDPLGSGFGGAEISITCGTKTLATQTYSTGSANGVYTLTWTPTEEVCPWQSNVTFSVTAADKAGKTTTVTKSAVFAFDDTPPLITAFSPTTGVISAATTFSVNVVDSGSGVESVILTIKCDGTVIATEPMAASSNAYTYIWTPVETTCSWGKPITVGVSAVNKNKKTAQENPVTNLVVKIDTTPPSVTNLAISPLAKTGEIEASSVTISADASDSGRGVGQVLVDLICKDGSGNITNTPFTAAEMTLNGGHYQKTWPMDNVSGCQFGSLVTFTVTAYDDKDGIIKENANKATTPYGSHPVVNYDAPPTVTILTTNMAITGSPAKISVKVKDIGSGVSTVNWSLSCINTSGDQISIPGDSKTGVTNLLELYNENTYELLWPFSGTPCAYNADGVNGVTIQVFAYDNTQPLTNAGTAPETGARFDYDGIAPVVQSVVLKDGTQSVSDIDKPVTITAVVTDTYGSGVNPSTVKLTVSCPGTAIPATLDMALAPSTTDTYTVSWPPVSGSNCLYNQTVNLEVAADDLKSNPAVPVSITPNYVYDYTAPTVTITPLVI